ncbi:MAG: hypothetical protein Q9227_007020 [Pyrenula ochraceoflavens]
MSVSAAWRTLGLPLGSSIEDVNKAYKARALAFHPDKQQGESRAHEVMCEMNNARDILVEELSKQKPATPSDKSRDVNNPADFAKAWSERGEPRAGPYADAPDFDSKEKFSSQRQRESPLTDNIENVVARLKLVRNNFGYIQRSLSGLGKTLSVELIEGDIGLHNALLAASLAVQHLRTAVVSCEEGTRRYKLGLYVTSAQHWVTMLEIEMEFLLTKTKAAVKDWHKMSSKEEKMRSYQVSMRCIEGEVSDLKRFAEALKACLDGSVSSRC